MGTFINIDNGGTLTDISVRDDSTDTFVFTKTLTTPHDLSECLFAGIEKVSEKLYGEADVTRLLHETEHIRYSTTQGTNALVQRQGPMVGILSSIPELEQGMQKDPAEKKLFTSLVGNRFLRFRTAGDSAVVEADIVSKVNRLTTLGAARLVIAASSPEEERRIRHLLLRKFPRHLLGSVPMLYSWELAADRNDSRRVWSCVVNSFLHSSMERFLYSAENRLKEYRVLNPLLVYRNDGASSRVAKSIALKTYSSGPRGGLEAAAALARAYDLRHVLMMDVGGTTTDVGTVDELTVVTQERGMVEGVEISYPMSEIASLGVGGSSVIQVVDSQIKVGPESVGAAPGPACFGFGGKRATITDVNLLLGVLDPDTYFDGTLVLDPDRSRSVIAETVAGPLGVSLEEALIRMEHAYFEGLSDKLKQLATSETTLLAFGGAGPMNATAAARLAGIKQVLVPHTAAVFSAFGIAFSDIGKTYEANLPEPTADSASATYEALRERAQRDMFQEGYALDECKLTCELLVESADGSVVSRAGYQAGDSVEYLGSVLTLQLAVMAPLPHPELVADAPTQTVIAPSAGSRQVRSAAHQVDTLPVYLLDQLSPGHSGDGPAIVEGTYFTARVLPGWTFRVTLSGDLLLTDVS